MEIEHARNPKLGGEVGEGGGEVAARDVVLSDRHGALEVQDHVPPPAGDEDHVAGSLHDLQWALLRLCDPKVSDSNN